MDLLDFYRGTLSSRRLGVLIKHLPVESVLVKALNDGQKPYSQLEHLVADVWALWAKKDHPKRAEMEAKAKARRKNARVVKLRSKFERRKRAYGLG